MTTDLVTRLPLELLQQILDHLDINDLKALSLTSSSLRITAVPRLFRDLPLSNNTTNLDKLQSFLSKYNQYVTRVRYNCNLRPREEDSTDILPMPQIIRDVLAGECLPNLELVELAFYPENEFQGQEIMENTSSWMNDTPIYEGLDSIWLFSDSETASQMQREEHDYQWRTDVAASFDAISRNKQIKQLEILNLIPIQCSSWHAEQWVKFISRLTTLKLVVWGAGDGVEGHVSTLPGYQAFLECIHPIFFKNAGTLRQLHLAGADWEAAGSDGYLIPITLRAILADDLPCLEYLTLGSCYVDQSLLNFLSPRHSAICSITLVDCWCAPDSEGEDVITWATFFSTLQDMEPKNLKKFTISSTKPIEFNFAAYEHEDYERRAGYDRGEVESLRRRLEENSDLRLFQYGTVQYGFNEESILESLRAGQDQKEYDALMDFVTAQAKKNISETPLSRRMQI